MSKLSGLEINLDTRKLKAIIGLIGGFAFQGTNGFHLLSTESSALPFYSFVLVMVGVLANLAYSFFITPQGATPKKLGNTEYAHIGLGLVIAILYVAAIANPATIGPALVSALTTVPPFFAGYFAPELVDAFVSTGQVAPSV